MGAFMAVHKQKREEAVRQSEKIIAENLKIAEKVKELRAKKQKLERLETKACPLQQAYAFYQVH